MSTFKKGKVVMITTDKFTLTTLCKCIRVNGLLMDALKLNRLSKPLTEKELEDANHGKDVIGIDRYFEAQHLYIISDDEIKLFDCVYNNKENIVEQINSKTQLIFVLEENKENQTFKKVIATTNESLYFKDTSKNPKQYMGSYMSMSLGERLPQPSQQFIQKYIEEYNKGNIITDVLVEYELVSNEEYFLNTINPDDDVPYFDENLKINPKDNTITIKKVKDSWSREEHISNIKKFSLELGSKIHCFLKEDGTLSISIQDVNKWVEENL